MFKPASAQLVIVDLIEYDRIYRGKENFKGWWGLIEDLHLSIQIQ
jgi:hypothetical protein